LTPVCTKSFVDWGFAPDPTRGAYSAPDPLAGFKGPYFLRGQEGRGRERGEWERKRVFVLCSRKKKKTQCVWGTTLGKLFKHMCLCHQAV